MGTELKNLLIVYHSRSGTVQKMAEAVLAGARTCEQVNVETLDPLNAPIKAVKQADAIIIGSPENFGYMSGAIKFFFEEIYYECLNTSRGLAYALFIAADNDGSGAVSSIERITTGLGWKSVADPIITKDGITKSTLESCKELGMTLSEGLELGLY
jgi:multimeric flavodoxin WrbA